jgi:hypothetical protein
VVFQTPKTAEKGKAIMSGRARGEWSLNDTERAQWIANDEGLYNWQRSSRLSVRAFIKANRDELDGIIRERLGHKGEAWQSRQYAT